MCYQFNHNEQGVMWQEGIIYCSAQHNGVKWANSREFFGNECEFSKRLKAMDTVISSSWAEKGIHYDMKLFSAVIAFDMSTNNVHNVSSVPHSLNSWIRWD